MADSGRPLKSEETSGASDTAKISHNSPFAAARKASFKSSAEIGFSNMQARSSSETFPTGARTASPDIFPANSGITSPMESAAPVEVGISDAPAARARRKSRCVPSVKFWSEVSA